MTAEQKVYETLAAAAALTALVSTRIFPVTAPENTALPYLVYQRIATDPQQTHDEGAGYTMDGVLFQLTAISEKNLEALQILAAARTALESASGMVALLQDQRATPLLEETRLYTPSADFLVWHHPT